jgi:uncharacterized OB-fold protein
MPDDETARKGDQTARAGGSARTDGEMARTPPGSLAQLSPDVWTEPFWLAAADHRLTVPRCRACGVHRMPPGPFCPACRSQEVEWNEVSGMGTVYSYTVARHALIPELAGSIPYVVAVIELDGAPGVRLVASVIETPVAAVTIGLRVEVVWEDVEGISVYRFRPAAA